MERTTNYKITNKLYLGFDNGVSGTIAAIYNDKVWFQKTPILKEQNYTKKKGNISRIDFLAFKKWIDGILEECTPKSCFCLIERPMVNPGRFTATISALRALEATLIIVEQTGLPFQYVDSKEWQRVLLPRGSKGDQLKTDSRDMGMRLFPEFTEMIKKHKDADGLLIAEYCRRYY